MSMTNWKTAGVLLALVAMTGCQPSTPTPAPTIVTTPVTTQTTQPTTIAPVPTSSSPSSAGGAEASAASAAVGAYSDFLNRAYADPSIPAWKVGDYVNDVPPDYLGQAVQQHLNKFRAEGKKETGNASVQVQTITAQADGSYLARACTDSSQVVVTDKDGKAIVGPTRGAADYTLAKGADGKWRVSRIKGVGTC